MRLKRAARAGRIGVVGPGRYVDSIDWVKQTVNRRMAKGHGYYLQHAKETCLVGKKVRTQLSLCRSEMVTQPTSRKRKDAWPACKRLLTIAFIRSLALTAHALARTNAQGEDPPGCRHGVATDVIFAERRGQSQKPEEIYELIEELVPNGMTVCKRARTHAATAAGS